MGQVGVVAPTTERADALDRARVALLLPGVRRGFVISVVPLAALDIWSGMTAGGGRNIGAGPFPAGMQDEAQWRLTAEGIPCLYYGTEQEFRGGNDPSNREDMWRPLPYLGQSAAPNPYDTGGPTFQWVQRLTGLRTAYPALRRGDAKVVYSTPHTGDEPDAGIFAYERTGGDTPTYALIVLNTNQVHDSRTAFENVAMQVSAPKGAVLVDVLGSKQQYTVAGDGTLDLTLAPVTGLLLVPQQDVK